MKRDITKTCADFLRSYLNDKHSIKLKSGHAHEIVAAFFGYKSKIALLADTQHPLSNLEKAEFIFLNPPTTFVDQRLKSLEELPPELPPSYILAEGVYPPLMAEKWILEKIQPTFRDLALILAEECLAQRMKPLDINPKTLQWITNVDIKTTETDVLLTVTFDSAMASGKLSRYCKVDIRLLRIAGNIGYGEPDIMPTFYSGQMHDADFRLKHGIS